MIIIYNEVTLRDMLESDIEDYVRWFTVEREWENWDAPWEKEATCFIMLNSASFVSCCAISETRKRYRVPFSSVTQYFLSLDQPLFIGSFVTKFISFLRSSICQTP